MTQSIWLAALVKYTSEVFYYTSEVVRPKRLGKSFRNRAKLRDNLHEVPNSSEPMTKFPGFLLKSSLTSLAAHAKILSIDMINDVDSD